MAFYIHTVMQNPDDFNTVCSLAVKDKVPAHMVLEVTLPDVIASTPYARITGQCIKTFVQL
jgi:hypothetical protein